MVGLVIKDYTHNPKVDVITLGLRRSIVVLIDAVCCGQLNLVTS